MPVVLSAHEASVDPEQLTTEILAHLAATEANSKLPLLRDLLLLLRQHTPQAYLQILSASELADWLRTFFTFLQQRTTDISLELLPLADRRLLLLTNSPDAPFLLDSIQNLLREEDLPFQVIFHPILQVYRKKGELLAIGGAQGEDRESFMALLVEGGGAEAVARLRQRITEILHAALCVQRDSQRLRHQLKELEEVAAAGAARDFLHWLQQSNFLPFAYRRLQVSMSSGQVVQESAAALGLPLADELPGDQGAPLSELPPTLRGRLQRKGMVMVEECEQISLLHRREPLIYFGLRAKRDDGSVLEHAFWGLFTQKAVDEPPCSTPALCQKIEQALATLQLPRDSHDYRKSLELLETFPKVELFFMSAEELARAARSFNLLHRRHGAVKVVGARGSSDTGMVLLVIMPRDFYSAENLARMEHYIRRFFRSAAVSTRVVRISTDFLSFHAAVKPGARSAPPDLLQLERGLTHLVRPWKSKLRMLLLRTSGEKEGALLWDRYREAFSREYQTLVHPRFAIRDVYGAERVLVSGAEAFDLWGPLASESARYFRLQFYSTQRSDLNELLPLLENLHLRVIDEVDFVIQGDGRAVFIKSFSVRAAAEGLPLGRLREKLLDLLVALRHGALEDDPFNRLLLLAGLDGRQIDSFRGYANYLQQLNPSVGKKRVAQALIRHPRIALLLYRYFETRFKPQVASHAAEGWREEALSPLRQELLSALRAVADLGDDRILRTLFNLIDSTVRTNFFLDRPLADYFFSFKISALGIIDMPAPRPLFEIYVHAAHMEGIHLRGGMVARGGIRWSDRPDDFRTEVLGLMKTQMSKNALIVPVGAKGGFIVKGAPIGAERQAADQAYRTLIRGLLELTDNRQGEDVLRPPQMVVYDSEDPYLVVAADKGTAHLSNTANAISAEYNFWLGDAFASGGSKGYDHKALGITARGAWVCVQRHFREMGKDIQTEPFTVIGIGDMSGDVFGNGMLLSRQIRLLAAFDHRHIFLDPEPDAAASFVERQRLFGLPRSSWDDYDRTLLSAGGGVYSRAAKEIPLSREVRCWLGIRREVVDGEELIRLLLAGEADLLWNGGVGAYVRASSEKDEDVGDRTNDPVRIDATQLRVRVVGEGGNLGLTQKARIEFALAGGRINTDAVDNSAGVDCSDHEVNLKIFMQLLESKGILAAGERDRLLVEVTDDVCQAVLADNAGQSLCLSLDQRRSSIDFEPFLDLADRLGSAGLLDRRGESLPSLKEVLARADRQLTRPELAVLMAYSKMQHSQLLLESELPALPAVRDLLIDYFPPLLRERFASYMAEHPLAREICATMIGNLLVNQAGSAFLNPLSRQMGVSPARVIAAYLTFDRLLEGAVLRREIGKVGKCSGAEREYALLLRLEEVLAALCKWALKHDMKISLEEERIGALRADLTAYRKILGSILAPVQWQQLQEDAGKLRDEGLDAEWAQRIAALPYLEDLLPSITLAERAGVDLHSVARTFNEVRQQLDMEAVLRQFSGVQLRDRWDRMAMQMLREAFAAAAFRISQAVWQESNGNLETFFGRRRQQVNFYRTLRDNLRGANPANFHPLTVLVRALEDLLSRGGSS